MMRAMGRGSYACVVLALLSVGCLDVGNGEGSLRGALYMKDCVDTDGDWGSLAVPRSYDMNPHFFVADSIDDYDKVGGGDNKLTIRVQRTGNRVDESDSLLITVANERDIADVVDQPIDVGPTTNLRATLVMNATCPDHASAAELDGTIQFSHFGGATDGIIPPDDFRINFDEPLSAVFAFTIVDRRAIELGGTGDVPTLPEVAGNLSGNFDFIMRQGNTAQGFQ
jgi:hypothetical protein